jgi:plastocyanin
VTLRICKYLLFVLALTAFEVPAATLSITVRDREGATVKDVVVIARPASGTAAATTRSRPAVMDQINRQFAPYVLAVHTGTSVLFENSDTVAHQVYSFSPARQFELGLYRGRPRSPIVFDQPGIVVLGCNIHDNMIGYVYVTDAPYFGTTDARGRIEFADLAAGDFTVELWSPRQSGNEAPLRRMITLTDAASLDFQFRHSLSPEPAPVRDPRLRDY